MKAQSITAVISIAISGLVQAAESAAIPFDELDTNKNGVLSIAEAGQLPAISDQWSTLDMNGDGQLSPGEYAGYETPAPAAGTESPAEAAEAPAAATN